MKTKVLQLNQQDLEAAQMHAAVNEVFNKEGDRLFNFIRSRVPTNEDAEDIFQEVFFQLSDAYLVAKDIRNGGAWVFRVARNKIIDFFRKHKTLRLDDMTYSGNDDGDVLSLTDIIPSSDTSDLILGKLWIDTKQHVVLKSQLTTKSSGMGLGLAMVKNIMETYNGNITFTSELEKGTTFRVSFPKE